MKAVASGTGDYLRHEGRCSPILGGEAAPYHPEFLSCFRGGDGHRTGQHDIIVIGPVQQVVAAGDALPVHGKRQAPPYDGGLRGDPGLEQK